MARLVYPSTGALSEQEIMDIARQLDGQGSGFDADELDGLSIEDFVTKSELVSFLGELNNEVPVLISRSFITPDASYNTFTASLPEVYMDYNVNELKTDWEISNSVDFDPNNIVASSYDKEQPDAGIWTPQSLVGNSRYYIRVRWKYRHHLGHWSFPLGYNLGNPTYIKEPTISIPGAPYEISTGPEIQTTPYDFVGNAGPHVATDWIIEDLYNNVVWESLGNTSHLTKITLPVGTLDTSTDYVFKVRHISATTYSNFGKITAKTSQYTYTNSFRDITSLPLGLRLLSSSLIKDNVTLISGGIENNFNVVKSTFIVDVDPNNGSGVFTQGPNLQVERYRHASSLLLDGRIMITGGVDNTNTLLDSTEVFIPGIAGNPDEIILGSVMAKPRKSHAQVTLNNGNVLITGGWTNTTPASTEAIMFIPAGSSGVGGTWVELPEMNQGRRNHGMCLLGNGTVLVTGGLDVTGNVLTSCEIFDPDGNGGQGTWTVIDPLTSARESHTQTQLTDGTALITGGVGNGNIYQNRSLIYDPELNLGSGGWLIVNGLNNERKWHTQTTLASGHVLVAGGFSSNTNLTSCELFS